MQDKGFFIELKEELNYSFQTASDTEVILAAVEEKGVQWFVDHANGMFSIALYNAQTKSLYLLRETNVFDKRFEEVDGLKTQNT